MVCCDIFEVFDEKNNLIKEYEYWKILVSNRTRTLGNSVVILKRHIERFSGIAKEEMQEFTQVVKDIENSLKNSFNYDKINWLMLMMKDKHVHFHVIPRYKNKISFAEIEWEDGFKGDPLTLGKIDLSQETLNKIKAELIKNFGGGK